MSTKIQSTSATNVEDVTTSDAMEVIVPDEANRADEPRVSGRRGRIGRGRRPTAAVEEESSAPAEPEPESSSPVDDGEGIVIVDDGEGEEEEGEDGGDELIDLGEPEESADTKSAASPVKTEVKTPAPAPAPKSRSDRFAAMAAKKREEEAKAEAAKAAPVAAPSRAGRMALLKEKKAVKQTLVDIFRNQFADNKAGAEVLRVMFPTLEAVIKADDKEFTELRDCIAGVLGFVPGESQVDAEGLHYVVAPECSFARVVSGNCFDGEDEELAADFSTFYPYKGEEFISESPFLLAFYTPIRECELEEAEDLAITIVEMMLSRLEA